MTTTRIEDDPGTEGYHLFEVLDDGERHSIEFLGQTYRMQFKGVRHGSQNHLEVTLPDGKVGKWGWGWESALCFKVLDNLREGKTEGKFKQYQAPCKEAEYL